MTTNTDDQNKNDDQSGNKDEVDLSKMDPETLKIIDKLTESKLKDIKSKLDNVYAERDAEKKRADTLAQEKRDAEIAALKAAGKEKEALELQIEEERQKTAEEKKKREAAEASSVALARDQTVRQVMTAYKWRTAGASEMAFKEIIASLIQNEKGEWVSRTNDPIGIAVKKFADNPENAFLLEQKPNTGGGSSKSKAGDESGPKSLFDTPVSDVLKKAAAGEFRRGARK